MAMAPTITFDKDQLRTELLGRLNDLTTMLRSVEVRQVLGKDPLAELPRFEKQIRQHLEETFQLVIVGDFKRGKSTLINALVQHPAVTVDVRPETVTINRIEYGAEPQVRASLENGGQVTFRPADLKREALEPLLQRLPSRARNLSVAAPAEFLKDLTIVDTPGLGDLFKEFDATVTDYLHHADAIIHVISALSPLSQGEQEFLRMAVAPQHFPKIVFVVNMLDALNSEDEAKKVLALIESKVGDLFPNSSVFGISALDEWCRTQKKPRPNPSRADALAARFKAFRQHLDEAILFNRTLIGADRSAGAFENMVAGLERKISLLKEALQIERRKLAETIAAFESRNSELHRFFEERSRELQQGIDDLAAQAQGWMDEFLTRFERDCLSAMPNSRFEDIQKHFQFFMIDRLRGAFESCLDAHQDKVTELLESARQDLAKNLATASLTSGRSLSLTATSFNDLPWSGLAMVHLAADMIFQAGLFIRLLLGQAHSAHEHKQAGKIADMVRGNLPKLRADVAGQIKTIYSQIAQQMIGQLRAAHEIDIAASLESMKQAQEIKSREEASKADIERTLAVVEESLESDGEFLKTFREKLWMSPAVFPA